MAAKYQIAIDQGATKRFRVIKEFRSGGTDQAPIYTGYDWSGCTARAQFRDKLNGTVYAEVTTTPGVSGGITFSTAASLNAEVAAHGGVGAYVDPTGAIDVELTAAATETFELRKMVWDIEVVFPSGDVVRAAQGTAVVDPNVTETP